jgi:hypothetical protein
VDLAEQIAGPETVIPGATPELVAHGSNNVVAADFGQGEHALVGQEVVPMAQVADERRDCFGQSHLPRQVRHQRLQPFACIVAKVLNRLCKEGHDLILILVRLPSEGLDDPQGVAEIELLDIVLVPVGLAILPQGLPALLGVPAEHFEALKESQPFFGIEMRSVDNLRRMLSDKPNVGPSKARCNSATTQAMV